MHEKIVIVLFFFSYTHLVNCTVENSTTTLEIYATVSSNDAIDSYPNTFYNQTVEIDGQDIVFRVVNGRAAQLGNVPYQVAMMGRTGRNSYRAFCGGSIIGPSKVLTAAHCFVKKKLSNCFKGKLSKSDFRNKYVMAGYLLTTARMSRSDSDHSGQWRKIRRGRYPKAYRFPRSDIAIIYLDRPFRYNAYISPIEYASVRKDYSGTCLISGYGRINNYQQSDRLLLADVEVLRNQECRRIHRKDMSKFVCTSDVVSDVHKGDSGGPIVCKGTGDPNDKGKGVQVGVTCGKIMHKRMTTFFTRVSYFYRFVNRCSSLRISCTFVILNCLINSFLLF